MNISNNFASGTILFSAFVAVLFSFIDFGKISAAKCLLCTMSMLILILLIFYIKQKQSYWKNIGVKTSEFSFLVGHMFKRLGLVEPFWKFYDEMYYEYNAKEVCGSYDFLKPILIVGNLQMVKKIFIKDFHCYSERRTLPLGKVSPIADGMLTNSHGEKWFQIRKSLSPTFTTMKLRKLLPIIRERCDILIKNLKNTNGKEVKTKEYCGTFTMETILSCAFGVQFEGVSNVNEFTEMGKRIFKLSPMRALKIIILLITPFVASVLGSFGVQFSSPEFLFFEEKVRQTMKIRRKLELKRGDLLDVMLDSGRLTESAIVSQAILFLLAGYDNTANTISFVLHVLAVNPDVQNKLRSEIQKAIEDGKDSSTDEYNIINDCEYLDAVLKESLRLYPVAPIIERKCTQATTISTLNGTNIPIQKGQIIAIPVWNFHRDPEYWKDHNIFKPERFINSPNNPAYMPFGLGPRNCIGRRFANIVVKTTIFNILRNIEVKPSENTINPPALDGRILTLQTINGLPLKFSVIS